MGNGGSSGIVYPRRATDAWRILRLDFKLDPDRDCRRARAQHPRWVHRPGLDRAWRVYVGWSLYGSQFDYTSRRAILDRNPCWRNDGGIDRHHCWHPLIAHQGYLSGDRDFGGAADHRMDNQPRPMDFGRRASLDHDPPPLDIWYRAEARMADLPIPDVLCRIGDCRNVEPRAQPHRPCLYCDTRPGHRRRDYWDRH